MKILGQNARRALFYTLILLAQGCAPALNWRHVHPEGADGLTVSFPCKPDVRDRVLQMPGLAGEAIHMWALTCDADDQKWALSYFDAGTPTRWLSAPSVWQKALQANLSALAADNGKPAIALPLDAAPAVRGSTPHPDAAMWQVRGLRPLSKQTKEPVLVNAAYFTKGLRVYQLTWWRRDEATSNAAWETFVESAHFSP